MSKLFVDGVKTPVTGLTDSFGTATYMSWVSAIALAERPKQRVQLFEGRPFLELFGGAIVAVEQDTALPHSTRVATQVTYLPVLALDNQPVALAQLNSRTLSDSINRCRAKAAAMVSGVGMSLYAGFGEEVVKFLNHLGLSPDSDLATAEPLVFELPGTKTKYIDWAVALAAARITDSQFAWETLWHDVPMGEAVRKLPVCKVPGGWMVAVRVVYKGEEHTEWLPIMTSFEPAQGETEGFQAMLEPTVADWNRAVMRCLAKAIAVASGYGLSTYADEVVSALHVQPLQPRRVMKESQRKELVDAVAALLEKSGRPVDNVMRWLGYPEDTKVAALDQENLERLHKALGGPTKPALAAEQPSQAQAA